MGVAAYLSWGFMPLFWPLLKPASALEILAHRITWSLLFVGALLARAGGLRRLFTLGRRRLALLAAASLLIGCNWGLYIWGVNSGRVVETALGYFINPLLTVALGVVVLRESLRPAQWAAIAVVVIAVVVLAFDYGRLLARPCPRRIVRRLRAAQEAGGGLGARRPLRRNGVLVLSGGDLPRRPRGARHGDIRVRLAVDVGPPAPHRCAHCDASPRIRRGCEPDPPEHHGPTAVHLPVAPVPVRGLRVPRGDADLAVARVRSRLGGARSLPRRRRPCSSCAARDGPELCARADAKSARYWRAVRLGAAARVRK